MNALDRYLTVQTNKTGILVDRVNEILSRCVEDCADQYIDKPLTTDMMQQIAHNVRSYIGEAERSGSIPPDIVHDMAFTVEDNNLVRVSVCLRKPLDYCDIEVKVQ
jgi:hypothetical protein